MKKQVGVFTTKIIQLLSLDIAISTPIYIGQ